ncbi:hypothetical protein ACQKIE_13360 [Luteibacter sp. NPDC031894]|uniref:hypothetical protein n=1 Tax=Luteibacter sp. NPDC031894 TaxID=3390572 RepID=UPI003D0881B7
MFLSLGKRLLWSIHCVGFLACSSDCVAQDTPNKTVIEMTEGERLALVADLQLALDNAMVGRNFFSEVPLPVRAEVSLDPATNLVVINVDERLGPEALSGEFDDFDSHITNALWILLERIDGVTGIDFRFGEFDADHWPANRRLSSPVTC